MAEPIYIVLRHSLNRGTGVKTVKPIFAFRNLEDAELYVSRKTQIKDIDWYDVQQVALEVKERSAWSRIFNRQPD